MRSLLEGHGYDVLEVEGDDPPGMHERFAATLGDCIRPDPRDPARRPARTAGDRERPRVAG